MTVMTQDANFSSLPSNASHFSNNTDQFGFDAELHQHGKNKAPMFHFHDFYEYVIYLGREPARYRLLDQEYEVNFGDIVRCDLMDEHTWLIQDNENHMRFSVGLTFSFVMSCSTKDDNLIQIFSRNGNSYPVLHLGSLDIHKYIDLIGAYQNCTLEHGKMVFQLGILHQMLAYLQDDFLRLNSGGAILTRQDNLVCELINYINLHLGEDLSLKTLGKVTNYNPTYLSRTFKNLTRSSLKLYIDQKRIHTATLLMGKGTPLTEIAMEVGFQNYCTFYNTFRRIMGSSPESYAKAQARQERQERQERAQDQDTGSALWTLAEEVRSPGV